MAFSRFAIFLVYFWFGALKVFSAKAAANPLVLALLAKTMPFIDPTTFIMLFGVFEMIIGVTFLLPKLNRVGLVLIAMHMIAVILPLVILPSYTWQAFFVPTLEGQYIIKNILIIALAMNIWRDIDQKAS